MQVYVYDYIQTVCLPCYIYQASPITQMDSGQALLCVQGSLHVCTIVEQRKHQSISNYVRFL